MDSDFYTEFENNFRGSREQIINVLSNYDGLIDYILNIDNDPSLLDIGSGRGEWIQKCNALGFKSIGLELDHKMVEDCKKINLNIKQGDALSLLDEFSEDSFSIVSAFHVIEHMKHENIQELIIKSKRILKPNGFLILETPSIDNLIVSSKSFYIDPTHINPIHPDLLGFMLSRTGFNKYKYYFINGGPLQNSEADSLTRIFNGVAQDIALIASKSNLLDNSIFDNCKLIKRDMRIGTTLLEAAIDFDNYSRNRYAQYDEAIFIMRKKIIDLERQLQSLIRLHNMSLFSIVIKLLRKLKRIIFILKDRLKNRIRSFLRYLSNRKLYIFMIKKIYKIQSIFYIIRYIEKMLDYLGFRIYQYKFVKRSKKIKEDLELVEKQDRYLETYFNSSQDAKNIFKDFNKYS
ncbi:methyltransferase domain-containing protein [Prochlorococcus marinus]|uniref:class I SAM-dependent methyltransferase n=1 Tax=Prochlorococcus marinus TaxID=1219 RepID=UPI0039AF638A